MLRQGLAYVSGGLGMRRAIPLVLCLVGLAGCQTTSSSDVVVSRTNPKTQAIEVDPESGTRYVASRQNNSVVFVIAPNDEILRGLGIPLAISVMNYGHAPVAFGAGQVKAMQAASNLVVVDHAGMQKIIRDIALSDDAPSDPPVILASTVGGPRAQEEAPARFAESNNTFLANVKLTPKSSTQGLVVLRGAAPGVPVKLRILVGKETHEFAVAADGAGDAVASNTYGPGAPAAVAPPPTVSVPDYTTNSTEVRRPPTRQRP